MARRPPIVALRRVLLVALLLLVLGVVGLFFFGRAGKRPARAPADTGEVQAEQGSTLIGEDFDYTFTEGQKPTFRIRGESIRADRQGTVFLQNVGVTLYDEEGKPYHVESRRGIFQRETNEGRLQGDVVLKGPGGLELRTAQLQMRNKGKMLVAPAASELRYGTLYLAHSQKIWVHLPEEVYVLAGKVRVERLPEAAAAATPGVAPAALAQGTQGAGPQEPISLSGERMVYERKRRQIRLEGGTELQRGREFIRARKLSANLTPDERALLFVRALWDVTGQLAASGDAAKSGGATTVRFTGKDLAVFMDPQTNEARKMALDGSEQQKVRMEAVGGGVTRILTARRIEGMLARGVLTSAEAFGGVEIRETGPRGPKDGSPNNRYAEGQRAVARFTPGGQVAGVDLVNHVTYRDPQVKAVGDRATVDFEGGKGEFLGNPVDVVSDRGNLQAPRVLYESANQLVHAVGGVRGVMEKVEDTALAGSPLGQGEGPVRVESQEAFWRQSPSSFLFRGEVRAWRGKNLLLTSELRGDKAEDRLTGTGGVKTVWIPTEEAAAGGGGKPRKATKETSTKETADNRAPIEVTSNDMAYRQGAGVLTYTGNVRVVQVGKTLTCNQLEVELGKDRKAETMRCTGEARLNDPKAGRNIAGDRAVYHIDQRQVEMFGDAGLVVMRDREGNQVQGKRLLYHIDDGKVEVLGGKEAAAPAAKTGGAG